MNVSFNRIFMGMVAVILAVSCPRVGNAAPTPEKVRLQLLWKHQFQFAGYYAAIEKGFYRDAGLDVTLLEPSPDEDSMQSVLKGDAEFGIGGSDLLLLRAKGQPVIALATIFQHSPIILLALRRPGMDNIHNLAGKKVMIEPHAAELMAYLQAEQISTGKMNLLPRNYDAQALLSGEVDVISAYSTDEPFDLEKAGKEYVTFSPRSAGIDFYRDTLFTTEKQAKDHPARTRAFIDASLRGWQYALANQTEMVDIIYTKYGHRHSVEHLTFEAARSRQLIMPDVVELGYMNPGRWKRIAEIYTELGMLPAGFSIRGFIFERNPRPDLTWFFIIMGSVLAGASVISWVAVRLYRLNKANLREMAERKQAEKRLQESEEKYSKAFLTSPYAITITRAKDGKFIEVNDAFIAISGFSREEATADSSVSLNLWVNIADRNQVVSSLFAGKEVIGKESLFKRKNGEIITGLFSTHIIHLNNEPFILASINDITGRKQAEEKLLSVLADLERSNKELEEFAYVASHDLQEPLRMVASYTQLLEQRYEGQLDEKAHKYINYAVDGVSRMQRLISDLLQYSRVGTRAKLPSPTDAQAVLDGAIGNLAAMIKESQAIITNEPLPTVKVDASQLELVFQNLIANAVKFKGADLPRVHISARDLGREWVFSVKDNGIGIEQQYQDRIFVLFQRLHTPQEYPGTGIGLAVCKRIVERQGGRIWFESEPGKGTTFFFTVPK